MKLNKPKIGLMGLSLELYQKNLADLMDSLKVFSEELKVVLEEMAEVVHYPLACSEEDMERAFS